MSTRIRGQEVTLRLSIDGQIIRGSMMAVTEFKANPRSDLEELPYIGEDEDEIDFQHHGYDLSWSVDMRDEVPLQILRDLVDGQKNRAAHKNVTMSVIYNFRGGSGGTSQVEVYHRLKLKISEQSVAGRKQGVTVAFEAKGRRKSTVPVA